jgi:hypothetical protein
MGWGRTVVAKLVELVIRVAMRAVLEVGKDLF